jgi:hypothetical protein
LRLCAEREAASGIWSEFSVAVKIDKCGISLLSLAIPQENIFNTNPGISPLAFPPDASLRKGPS